MKRTKAYGPCLWGHCTREATEIVAFKKYGRWDEKPYFQRRMCDEHTEIAVRYQQSKAVVL